MRRLPSTTIELAVRPLPAGAAKAAPVQRPQMTSPRSKPATTSPRFTRTHMPMRKAPFTPRGRPQWRVTSDLPQFCSLSLGFVLVFPPLVPSPYCPCHAPRALSTPSLRRPQVNDVIEGCKYHQHHDDRETDAKPDLLRPLRQRPAPQRL